MNKVFLIIPVASLLLLQACSSGPTSKTVEEQLDEQAKGLWDFKNVEISESKTDKDSASKVTYLQFKATGVNSEPTYQSLTPQTPVSFWLQGKKDEVEYVKVVHDKGSEVGMDGNMVMSQDPKTKQWSSLIAFNTPLKNQGIPKSQLQPNQVVKGSTEEKQLQAQQAETQQLDRDATLKRLFAQESSGYMSGDLRGIIKLRFDEVDEAAKTVKGQATFSRGVIKGFTGKYTDRDLVLTTDSEIQGKDKIGVGTKFSLLIEALEPSTTQVKGTYGHSDRRSGNFFVNLGS